MPIPGKHTVFMVRTVLAPTLTYKLNSILLLQLNDHMMNECTWIKCSCSSEEEDVRYEVCTSV